MVIKTNKLFFLSIITAFSIGSVSTIECMYSVRSWSKELERWSKEVDSWSKEKMLEKVNKVNKNGLTLFDIACKDGNSHIIKKFLPYCYKETFNRVNLNDKTPVHMACESGSVESVRLLLKYYYCTKKIINRVNEDGETPFYAACKGGPYSSCNFKIVKLLFPDCKETVNRACKDNMTPIYWACFHGCFKAVKLLLPYYTKETINKVDKGTGDTLFHIAYRNSGSVDMVKLLMPHCTKDTINSVNKEKKTALYHACFYGCFEIVKLLLLNNVKIDFKSQKEVEDKLTIKKYIDTVLGYNKSKDKVEYILDLLDHNDIEMYIFLLEVAFGRSDSGRINKKDLEIFSKLYKIYCGNKTLRLVFGVEYKLDMFKFIKEVLEKKDKKYFIYDKSLLTKQDFSNKIKEKISNNHFVDCAIKLSYSVNKTNNNDNIKKLLKLKREKLLCLIEEYSNKEDFLGLLTERLAYKDEKEISKLTLELKKIEGNIETVKKELSLLEPSNLELKMKVKKV